MYFCCFMLMVYIFLRSFRDMIFFRHFLSRSAGLRQSAAERTHIQHIFYGGYFHSSCSLASRSARILTIVGRSPEIKEVAETNIQNRAANNKNDREKNKK